MEGSEMEGGMTWDRERYRIALEWARVGSKRHAGAAPEQREGCRLGLLDPEQPLTRSTASLRSPSHYAMLGVFLVLVNVKGGACRCRGPNLDQVCGGPSGAP